MKAQNIYFFVWVFNACTHTHSPMGVTQTQIPCCFQARGAGENRLPNFPSLSTLLHMQMLITTGACMGQSAGWWNSLCISLYPPTGRRFHSYFPWLIIKIITSDFLHGSFSPARLLKGQSAAVWFSMLSAYQHTTGRGFGAGGQVDAPPATRTPEGTDSFSRGLRYGEVMSVRLSIRYGVIVVGGK